MPFIFCKSSSTLESALHNTCGIVIYRKKVVLPRSLGDLRRLKTLLPVHEQPFNLRHNLLIAKTGTTDGPGRTGSHTGATSLAQRMFNLRHHSVFMEDDGIKWAKIITNTAAGTS